MENHYAYYNFLQIPIIFFIFSFDFSYKNCFLDFRIIYRWNFLYCLLVRVVAAAIEDVKVAKLVRVRGSCRPTGVGIETRSEISRVNYAED